MVTDTRLEAELRALAGSVPDPELPVLTLADLGVLREVHLTGPGSVEVELTPTYTGCPAVETMSADIERLLHAHGIREVTVRSVLSPPWSTDDISAEGRRKLREFGIAPPRTTRAAGPVAVPLGPTRTGAAGAAHAGAGAGANSAGTDPARTDVGTGLPRSADGSSFPANGSPFPADESLRCPHCDSPRSELLSRFSSTACKALRRCLDCREPFDHFKEL
ncbi:1,2-phenylacetyl-CoA epoxidase subunit PaaD [Streptomyces physcomitrii]|uniref:Phenylacetate-CoA oxygenase subunit PaaJ n=1 Tax=Streptomyces physcomitrii TaxID=2724184 RepID=A0ABX1H177_9ACTN|nr:1,2-phenylacetyl-CoA epoxidase subunit PaaD [Streptomyces physcomitrii]NKI41065.1 phenylacetate-CoA oxygenase subunit PaaJ [Streptomyces physcomitrii]